MQWLKLLYKKRLVEEKGNNSSQVRKRLKFHSSNSPQENVTHATGDISSGSQNKSHQMSTNANNAVQLTNTKLLSVENRLVTGAANAEEISPVFLSSKQKSVACSWIKRQSHGSHQHSWLLDTAIQCFQCRCGYPICTNTINLVQ